MKYITTISEGPPKHFFSIEMWNTGWTTANSDISSTHKLHYQHCWIFYKDQYIRDWAFLSYQIFFLPKSLNTLHKWNIQIHPIINLKLQISSSNFWKGLLMDLCCYRPLLDYFHLLREIITKFCPNNLASPTSNQPIWDLHLLP